MKIASIVGARPNFVKIAPLAWEIAAREGIEHTIVHTGQHYDESMSDGFFESLEIPEPDINLGVGSDGHGRQTGRIMIELEPVLEELEPDWVVTVGDVNSTAAATMVAVKLGISTAHVEAGLRSFDRSMPEEINRMVTDAISALHLVTEQSGHDNLVREGVDPSRIHFVGNIMIDWLVRALPKARELKAWERFGLEPGGYLLVTLHRPSNVDDHEQLEGLARALASMGKRRNVLFPAHPRTRRNLENFGLGKLLSEREGVALTEPMDYITFLSLVTSARALITDSGGIQEETTYLGIPCITLRSNTERPVTVEIGTNELVTPTGDGLLAAFEKLEAGNWKKGTVPRLWDGKTAVRIIDALSGALP